MRATLAALLLSLSAFSSAGAQESPAKWFEDFEKKFPPVGKNAAAEELERLSLALGVDSYGESGNEHPTKEDLDGFQNAGFGSWFDAQIKTSDDSVGAPPPRLSAFLEKRQATIGLGGRARNASRPASLFRGPSSSSHADTHTGAAPDCSPAPILDTPPSRGVGSLAV